MYLCVEITNYLHFTVSLWYTSINDFRRIEKTKTVKGFEKNYVRTKNYLLLV